MTVPGTAAPHSCLDQQLSAYDYELPETLIAQVPLVPRDRSRLLVVGPTTHQHQQFRALPTLLKPGDLLVLNNTRVIPARLMGRKVNPQAPQALPVAVEVLLLDPRADQSWLALVKPGRRLKPGTRIEFGPLGDRCLSATILAIDPATRGRIIQFESAPGTSFEEQLYQWGQIPFPPYIQDSPAQPEQYQTIFAEQPGAIAAPTAGLHFTPDLLKTLQAQNIHQAWITLHVGVGTFRPVEAEQITEHTMHAEWVDIPIETVNAIRRTQAQGGRVIAVGTTVVRALEAAAQQGQLQPLRDKTDLFIYPGYQWRVVEGLITNFHLPRSSLLMLVSALIGRQRLLDLYQVAIDQNYRFYSFGDAMLILPEAAQTITGAETAIC